MTSDSEFKIFISHKSTDAEHAKEIKQQLELATPQLKVFLSQDIQKGDKWEEEIRVALRESYWLIFLYTDPSARWDWCIYEVGLFAGYVEKEKEEKEGKKSEYAEMKKEKERRIICMHHKKAQPPEPLKQGQCVYVDGEDLDDVVKLLKQLFHPIHEKLSSSIDSLKELSGIIVSAFTPKVKEEPEDDRDFNKSLLLSMDSSQLENLKKKRQVPNEALVQKCDKESLKMFGRTPNPKDEYYTWGELLEGMKEPKQYNAWMK